MVHENIKMNCKRKYKTHLLGRMYTNFILNDKKKVHKYSNYSYFYINIFYTNISCNKYNVLFLTFQENRILKRHRFTQKNNRKMY